MREGRYSKNIKPLSKLDGWDIDESDPDIRGWTVMDRDEENIGKVDDLLVDMDKGVVTFIAVAYDQVLGLGGGKTIVPVDEVRMNSEQESLIFMGKPEEIKGGPDYSSDTSDYGPFIDYWSKDRKQTTKHEHRETVQGRKGGTGAVKERETHHTEHKRSGKLDINDASEEELIALPGIGPTIAKEIISFRKKHGHLKNINELEEVRGISSSTIEHLKKYVTIGRKH